MGQEWRINQLALHADCIDPALLVYQNPSPTIYEPCSASVGNHGLESVNSIGSEDDPSESIHNTPATSPDPPVPSIHSLHNSPAYQAAAQPPVGPIQCQINSGKCSKVFPDENSLKDHITEDHRHPCRWGCENVAYRRQGELSRHYNNIHQPGENYQCACEHSQTKRRDNHKRHLIACSIQEGAYTCGNCGIKRYEKKEDHQAHIQSCQKRRGRKPNQSTMG